MSASQTFPPCFYVLTFTSFVHWDKFVPTFVKYYAKTNSALGQNIASMKLV